MSAPLFSLLVTTVNRAQTCEGSNILGMLAPTIIHLMMVNHNQVWGDACYPVVE